LRKVGEKLRELGARRVRIGRKWVVVLKPENYRMGDRIILDFESDRDG